MDEVFLEDVTVGQSLPSLELEVTPTFVISTAMATRDFQDVHHDRDRAQGSGAKDIFLNILTTNGLVARLVTDWAGPRARLRRTSIRLGVPAYAGDTLVLSGSVSGVDPETGDVEITVRGTDSLGDHASGTVVVALPRRQPGAA